MPNDFGNWQKDNCYMSPYFPCIYVAPWLDYWCIHWYVLGVGLAVFGLWKVKPSLRWLAGIVYGLVGWYYFCEWTGWHPLPNCDVVAIIGYPFGMWLHCYIEGQDKKNPKPEGWE